LCAGAAGGRAEELVINHADPPDPARLFWGGPVVILLLVAGLCALGLLALLLGRAAPLARLGERAAARLDGGRIAPTLWGLAAALLVLFLCGVLFSRHALALLGVAVLACGLALASLGLGAAALALGLRLSDALGAMDLETLPALRLGLWTLLLASGVPFVGWLLVLLVLASGVGATLEMLLTRPSSGHAE